MNILAQFSLEGMVAVVTGGAHGIGYAIGAALAQAGAALVFNGTNAERIDAAERQYKDEGIQAKGYVCDVSKENEVRSFVAEVVKAYGHIDILVNNAAVTQRTPLTEMEAEDFRRIIDVDLIAPFLMAKAVLPGMIERGHGKIINICSLMSELGRETVSAYAAAKGGLKMLTRNICAEYGNANIQCNGIGPGYIATSQTAPLRTPGSSFEQFILNKTPANRWGTPEDLMGPAVFLASRASDFVNGHILYVDGGILASLGRQP